MRIQKKFQGTVPKNKILDTYSESQTDTYSCKTINDLVGAGGGSIDMTVPIASESKLGGIKVGRNLSIEEDGTLNAEAGDVSKEYVDSLIGDINSVLATLTEVN